MMPNRKMRRAEAKLQRCGESPSLRRRLSYYDVFHYVRLQEWIVRSSADGYQAPVRQIPWHRLPGYVVLSDDDIQKPQ